jgi:hypothetical protein
MALLSRKSSRKLKLGHETTATAPSGDKMVYGSIVNIVGLDDHMFKFRYARHKGTEITVFGGLPHHPMTRSFKVEQVASVGPNLRLVGLQADADAVIAREKAYDARYEGLTPGQKAALTKRLRAAA